MNRFHIHVGVENLEKSVQFYSTLFGQRPAKLKKDYAKWMLENPRLNFAISTRTGERGVNHLGFQVESKTELEAITDRLKNADLGVFDEGETTCCYAESNKAWVQDPSGIAWEAYQTMADAELYRGNADAGEAEDAACCVPDQSTTSCCG